MLTLTLDTSCVIHGAQGGSQHLTVERLVDLAREGRVELSLTSAYAREQARAGEGYREANARWLRQAPILGPIPGPFRLDYSVLDGSDVLATDDVAELDAIVSHIVLPPRLRPEALAKRDPYESLAEREVRRLHDVQHLTAHAMAHHDAFVTDDKDDILSKRDRLLAEAGITVWSPEEALATASSQ